MAAALGTKQIQFEFANLCLVSLDQIFNLFFYPLAAIICPSFILHIGTFLYIAKVNNNNKDQKKNYIVIIIHNNNNNNNFFFLS